MEPLATVSLVVAMLDVRDAERTIVSNIVIKGFGYTTKQALILSTPGGLVAALTTLACGYYSDKKVRRHAPASFLCL